MSRRRPPTVLHASGQTLAQLAVSLSTTPGALRLHQNAGRPVPDGPDGALTFSPEAVKAFLDEYGGLLG